VGLRERLDSLSRGELAGLVVVVAITLAGAGLWYVRSLPKPVAIEHGAAPSGGALAAGASASASGPPIIVDVTGWVREPGVYEFAQGDRVIDAVERAGGARPNADLSVLNLAAPLTDGSQVALPKLGAGGPGDGAAPGESSSSASSSGALININTAAATELEELSGIGEVLAAAIVDYRTDNGPFASVDELEDVSGIGPATLDEIRDQVTV
jgi:competence protein ComEA